MPNDSLFKAQKATKPKIETIITEWPDGDMKKNALDFVAWLRANKMSPTWVSANSWKSSYKGTGICRIKLLYSEREDDKNKKYTWFIATGMSDRAKHDSFLEREGLLVHIRDHPWFCNCTLNGMPQNCGSRQDITILGKTIKAVCGHYYPWYFCDPDAATIEGIKKLIEAERKERGAK
ncbi:MAG: hypothetical protein FWC71_00620 [Defluviitaleaceae bacterium]|nr:hypothetical protein [Defluviitaleaceae bacterium]